MQIDFHHTVTYVVARLAGFTAPEADTIAYAAQYIDDATQSGMVRFDNGFLYRRVSTAHRALDLKNLKEEEASLVWVPFHFLPGNGGLPAGIDPGGRPNDRLITLHASPVAQAMMRETIAQQRRPYGLHRLGVTMHVYADAWAHEGFAGVKDKVNRVDDVSKISNDDETLRERIGERLRDATTKATPALGHARALVYPDLPFLQWEYVNGLGTPVVRDNPTEFLAAADAMCREMKRYRIGDPDAAEAGIDSDRDRDVMLQLFRITTNEEGEKRHLQWRRMIAGGEFSFGPEQVSYAAEGESSWKSQALGKRWKLAKKYKYSPAFLTSDWKLFHDAAQAHRFFVLRELLPRYGICVA